MGNPDCLEGIILFKDLDADERRICVDLMEDVSYDKGQAIISEGEIGNTIFMIKSGLVQITKKAGTGEKLLATLTEGEFFGEICIFESGIRTATAQATMPTRLLLIGKEPFERLVNEHPRIGVKILTAMMHEVAHRLHESDDMLIDWVVWARAAHQADRRIHPFFPRSK